MPHRKPETPPQARIYSTKSIAHVNTKSLITTFDAFHLILENHKFHIVALSETWLKDNKHQHEYVQILGYNTVFRNRENKKGGGVGFYVKDHLRFTLRNDIMKVDNSIETIWIEVRGKNKNSAFLIGGFYQPSSDEKEKQCWLEKFDYLIAEVYAKWNGMIIIAGGFNINLNRDSGESTQLYKQILHSFSLKQYINKPTQKNKTLIDHIYSNIPTKVVHSDVLHTGDISDHDMPYTILNVKKERYEQRYKYIRSEKDSDINSYVSDFRELPLNLV